MSRTELALLRRRMLATTHRIHNASTVAGGTGGASVIIGVFAVAWLFTGHMGPLEPLRLFVIAFTAVLVTVTLAAAAVIALSKIALNRAEESLIRGGVHALPEPTYFRGRVSADESGVHL